MVQFWSSLGLRPISPYTWPHVQDFRFSRLHWNGCESGGLVPRDGFWRSLSSWRDCGPASVPTHGGGQCRIALLVCKRMSHFLLHAVGTYHVTVHLVDHCPFFPWAWFHTPGNTPTMPVNIQQQKNRAIQLPFAGYVLCRGRMATQQVSRLSPELAPQNKDGCCVNYLLKGQKES